MRDYMNELVLFVSKPRIVCLVMTFVIRFFLLFGFVLFVFFYFCFLSFMFFIFMCLLVCVCNKDAH